MKERQSGTGGLVSELIAGFNNVGIGLQRIELGVLCMLFFGVVLLGLTQMFLRNFLDTGISWADPVLRAAMLWMTMVAAVMAAGRLAHFRIRTLEDLLPQPWQQVSKSLMLILTGVVCLILMVQALKAVGLERSFNDIAFFNVPVWQIQLIVPVGFVLMAARFFAHALAPLAVYWMTSGKDDKGALGDDRPGS